MSEPTATDIRASLRKRKSAQAGVEHDESSNDVNDQSEKKNVNSAVQSPQKKANKGQTKEATAVSSAEGMEVKTTPAMATSPPPTTNSTSTRKRRVASSTIAGDVSNGSKVSAKRRSRPTSTPRTGGKRKLQKEPVPSMIKLDDPNDPYNFAVNSDVHPEPLKNISMERSTFGDIRFTKSSPGFAADRYTKLEQAAAGSNPRLSGNSMASPMHEQPTSLSMLSSSSLRFELTATEGTPKTALTTSLTAGSSSRSRSRKKKVSLKDEDDDFMDEHQMEVDEDEPKAQKSKRQTQSPKMPSKALKNTPSLEGKKTPKSTDYSFTISGRKKITDELYIVPELSSTEQFAVDHPQNMQHFLEPGARVLALWGNEYYAANVCGREALGRYYVHFVEDNLNRILPPDGVIPIAFLRSGTRLSFIDFVDNEEVGKQAVVIAQPGDADQKDPQNWVRGEFELRELDEDDDLKPAETTRKVPWSKLYLDKEQGAQVLQQGKVFNPCLNIDQENIVNESRAARRSRTTRISLEQVLSSPLKFESPTTQSGRQMETPKSPKGGPNKKDETASSGRRKRNRSNKEEEGVDANEETAAKEPNGADNNKPDGMEIHQDEEDNPEDGPEEDEEVEKKEEEQEGGGSNTTTDEPGTPVAVAHKTTTNGSFLNVAAPGPNCSQQLLPSPEYGQDNGIALKEQSVEPPACEENIFAGLRFVLTSANRPNKVSQWNKREYRTKIEERGGIVVEDFTKLEQLAGTKAFLIADTHYRTHKYLCALSLSIPCVDYKWVQECFAANELVDYEPFLLPAGESTLEPGRVFQWKPLKDVLFGGKRVLVYSKLVIDDPKLIPFGDIWTQLMRNLGATIVGDSPGEEPFCWRKFAPTTLEQKLELLDKVDFDLLLTEQDCEPELAEKAQAKGCKAVSSEYIIEAIVTGQLPSVESSERFRYDFC